MTEEEMMNGVSMDALPRKTVAEMQPADAQIPVSVSGQGSYNVPLKDVLGTAAQAAADNTSEALVNHTGSEDPHPQYAMDTELSTHVDNSNNPHGTTAAQVGLGNVDNTADTDKPVSTAQASAINGSMSGHTGSEDPHPQYVLGTEIGLTIPPLINGAIPSQYIPGSYNEVQYYDTLGDLPTIGDDDVIYVTRSDGFTYRWGGEDYRRLNASLALGETADTAYPGNKGKAAYDHAMSEGNPHGMTKSDLGLGNVDNTADADKPLSAAQLTALNDKVSKTDTAEQAVTSPVTFIGRVRQFSSSVTTGISSFVARKAVDATAVYRSCRLALSFGDNGFVVETRSSSAYGNGNEFAIKRGSGTGATDDSFSTEDDVLVINSDNETVVAKAIRVKRADNSNGGLVFFGRPDSAYSTYVGYPPASTSNLVFEIRNSAGSAQIDIIADNVYGKVRIITGDGLVFDFARLGGLTLPTSPASNSNDTSAATTGWAAKKATGASTSVSSGATLTAITNGHTYLLGAGGSCTLQASAGVIGDRVFFALSGCAGGTIAVNGFSKSGTVNMFGIIAEKNAVGWSIC